MSDPVPASPAAPPSRKPPDLREVITDALRYWEKKRLLYNAILAAVVLGVAGSDVGLILLSSRILSLIVLALMANICFCAAYVPDVFVQMSDYRLEWRRKRVWLMVFGTALSAIMAAVMVLALLH